LGGRNGQYLQNFGGDHFREQETDGINHITLKQTLKDVRVGCEVAIWVEVTQNRIQCFALIIIIFLLDVIRGIV
jgi:hypothetical protein